MSNAPKSKQTASHVKPLSNREFKRMLARMPADAKDAVKIMAGRKPWTDDSGKVVGAVFQGMHE